MCWLTAWTGKHQDLHSMSPHLGCSMYPVLLAESFPHCLYYDSCLGNSLYVSYSVLILPVFLPEVRPQMLSLVLGPCYYLIDVLDSQPRALPVGHGTVLANYQLYNLDRIHKPIYASIFPSVNWESHYLPKRIFWGFLVLWLGQYLAQLNTQEEIYCYHSLYLGLHRADWCWPWYRTYHQLTINSMSQFYLQSLLLPSS